ncbi:MAG: gephyrin-like molybdotransferase Glp [Nitrospinaceae bacterium]
MSMITVAEALSAILSKMKFKGVEKVALDRCLGRVLAEDVVSTRNNPPLDNSAMDGFALIAGDIQTATPESPVRLQLTGNVPAGYQSDQTLKRGETFRIMTGAPIPAGADCVLMQEDTERDGDHILCLDKAVPGENIRRAGEDVRAGETVIAKGVTLTPSHIGMMAVVGRSSMAVAQRPVVAVLSTGDEIVDLDGDATGPRIYNSNGYMLCAQIRAAGAVPVYLGIARDTEEDLLRHFEWALKCDAIVSSGGVSVGDYDLVKATLDRLGNEMSFWKVAMKPGKPLAFGRIGSRPVFGLPGNPVSSFVSFEQFVRPALRKMMGARDLLLRTVKARLTQTVTKRTKRLHFMSATLASQDGEYTVTPAGEQGSGVLKSAMNANGLMIFPLECDALQAGETVTVQMLES